MNLDVLRKSLIELLRGGSAHVDLDHALSAPPLTKQGMRPDGLPHSAWELLEHMRITQWDILEFVRNPKHVSPEFPKGYWPESPAPASESDWAKSVSQFKSNLQEMIDLVENPETDWDGAIEHGDGQTTLREVLLTADHNAYHVGQLILVRRLLGNWK